MLKQLLTYSVLFVLVLGNFSPSSQGAITVPDDQPYYTFDHDNFRYIFTEDSFSLIPGLAHQSHRINELYRKNFQWTLDERTSLILAGSQNQMANGFASNFPNIHTVFFNGGSELLNSFGSKSWLHSLVSHEFSHLYQLNPKEVFSASLQKIIGNPASIPYLTVVHPNVMLPTFIVEGNAMLNENRFGNGGRLYNGGYLALFLNYLKLGHITPERLINDHLEFPYGLEKYVIGGYFQYYLNQRFGLEKVNSFFMANATHFVNPFLLNSTFVSTFGVGYEELIKDFVKYYTPLAQKQIRQSPPPTTTSVLNAPLSDNAQEIYFLTSPTGRSKPLLNRINKQTNIWTQEESTLPLGKLFVVDGSVFTRTSNFNGPSHLLYGLYDQSMSPHPDYLGKVVYHVEPEKLIYAKPERSIDQTEMIINEMPMAKIHSEPMVGPMGSVYYFQQIEEERVLFKNQEELGRFKGFHSHIVHISEQGEVFFIAPTEFGSSLFSLKEDHFFRWLSSDALVDGRPTQDGWLLVEVSGEGFNYFLKRSLVSNKESPYYLEYSFDKHSLFKQDNSFENYGHIETPEFFTPYHGLKNLRFNSLEPWLGVSEVAGAYGQAIARFSDPLQHNNLLTGLIKGPFAEISGILLYQNSKKKLGWYLGYLYDEKKSLNFDQTEVLDTFLEYQAFGGIDWSLYRAGRWSLNWILEGAYTNDEFSFPEEQFFVTTWARLSQSYAYPLSFDFAQSNQFLLGYRKVADAPYWRGRSESLIFSYLGKYDLGHEWIVNYGYQKGAASSASFTLTGTQSYRDNPFLISKFSPGQTVGLSEVDLVQFGIKKVINKSAYFSIFPLSLRRFAPFIKGNYFDTKKSNTNSPEARFLEWAYGVEVELLFVHKLPLRFKLGKVQKESAFGRSHWQEILINGYWNF